MSVAAPKSDGDVLDLLRISGPLGVPELADAMEVTPTAVRQRLTRLLGKEMIHARQSAAAAAGPSTATG